jgi:sulfur relay (sulfurtransferase) DsrC/TusE family protein
MIKSVDNYPVSTLFNIEAAVVYNIPRYQREYTWSKWQWDTLFEDLLDNDPSYFLGSIICINQSTDALAIQALELVDGQQRMTTLSLLMAAIFKCYNDLELTLDMPQQIELYNLKNKLILKNNPGRTRLTPQVQNCNQQDYFWVLKQAGILDDAEHIANAGNRRVLRAFRHFCNRINDYLLETDNNVSAITQLIDKVNTATLVKIEVASHSDAYTLFESLNNRGVPLTAIDLIKNKLLAKLEMDDVGQIDRHFTNWMKVLGALGDDYAVQERYFRQYYNAFKPKLKDIVNVPVATKSNLIQVYEKLISHDAKTFLAKMMKHSELYAQIICNKPVEEQPKLTRLLKDLERVQGVPSYLLLMLLFARQDHLELTAEHLEKVTHLLIAFFVRRNTTDKPATRDLTRIFMDLATILPGLRGDAIYEKVCEMLVGVSADDEQFIKELSGGLYDDNKAVCRFVLCAIEQSRMTRETQRDLWELKGKQFVWTIEHIFPQGENIPEFWVDMVAGGDIELAKQFHNSHVHKLGNLTISGYNSTLGNKSFIEKRDRTDQKGRAVGYNNGLYLNQELVSVDSWSTDQIDKRTAALVAQILDMFQLPRLTEFTR